MLFISEVSLNNIYSTYSLVYISFTYLYFNLGRPGQIQTKCRALTYLHRKADIQSKSMTQEIIFRLFLKKRQQINIFYLLKMNSITSIILI